MEFYNLIKTTARELRIWFRLSVSRTHDYRKPTPGLTVYLVTEQFTDRIVYHVEKLYSQGEVLIAIKDSILYRMEPASTIYNSIIVSGDYFVYDDTMLRQIKPRGPIVLNNCKKTRIPLPDSIVFGFDRCKKKYDNQVDLYTYLLTLGIPVQSFYAMYDKFLSIHESLTHLLSFLNTIPLNVNDFTQIEKDINYFFYSIEDDGSILTYVLEDHHTDCTDCYYFSKEIEEFRVQIYFEKLHLTNKKKKFDLMYKEHISLEDKVTAIQARQTALRLKIKDISREVLMLKHGRKLYRIIKSNQLNKFKIMSKSLTKLHHNSEALYQAYFAELNNKNSQRIKYDFLIKKNNQRLNKLSKVREQIADLKSRFPKIQKIQINTLPTEIILNIAKNLKIDSRYNLSLTSQRFRNMQVSLINPEEMSKLILRNNELRFRDINTNKVLSTKSYAACKNHTDILIVFLRKFCNMLKSLPTYDNVFFYEALWFSSRYCAEIFLTYTGLIDSYFKAEANRSINDTRFTLIVLCDKLAQCLSIKNTFKYRHYVGVSFNVSNSAMKLYDHICEFLSIYPDTSISGIDRYSVLIMGDPPYHNSRNLFVASHEKLNIKDKTVYNNPFVPQNGFIESDSRNQIVKRDEIDFNVYFSDTCRHIVHGYKFPLFADYHAEFYIVEMELNPVLTEVSGHNLLCGLNTLNNVLIPQVTIDDISKTERNFFAADQLILCIQKICPHIGICVYDSINSRLEVYPGRERLANEYILLVNSGAHWQNGVVDSIHIQDDEEDDDDDMYDDIDYSLLNTQSNIAPQADDMAGDEEIAALTQKNSVMDDIFGDFFEKDLNMVPEESEEKQSPEVDVAPEEANSDEDQEENDEEEVELQYKIDWAEDIEEDTCCIQLHNLTNSNYSASISAMNQYKKPGNFTINCMIITLTNAYNHLEILAGLEDIDATRTEFIETLIRFRHDVFGFIMLRSVLNFNILTIETDKKISDFVNDEHIPEFLSNRERTPDYIYRDGNNITIFEISVTASFVRTNFQKGFNTSNSKYKNEIDKLTALGYIVDYRVVSWSTSDTFDNNLRRLKTSGYDIIDISMQYLEKYHQSLKNSYNYLFSYNFLTPIQDLRFPDSLNIDKELTSEGFEIKQIDKVNRSNFYRIMSFMKQFIFEDDKDYYIRITKKGVVFTEKYGGIRGKHFNIGKIDEVYIYMLLKKQFNDIMFGKETVFALGKTQPEHIDYDVTIHGDRIDMVDPPTATMFKNTRLKCKYDINKAHAILNVLKNNSMNGLNTRNERSLVSIGIDEFSKAMSNLNTVDLTSVPPKLNDPRRSFEILAETALIKNIDYKLGPRVSFTDECCSVFVSKLMNEYDLDKLSYGAYTEVVNVDTTELTAATSRFFENLGALREKKISRLTIDDFPDVEKYQEHLKLKDEMRRIQSKHQHALNSMNRTHGRVKLSADMRQSVKDEKPWGGNQGFKLFIDSIDKADLPALFDFMRKPTKSLFEIELPNNIQDNEYNIKIKELLLNEITDHSSEIMNTNLFNHAVMLSRLAYTLTNLSQQTFNSNYCSVDNIGLSNTMLIVLGGKKLTSSRRTKIFKLIYPTDSICAVWNSNKRMFTADNISYEETPWQQTHQSNMPDWIAAPYKLLTAYLFLREKYSMQESIKMLTMPFLMMLHNRRKTEIIMHNTRYLAVNCLGEFSQLSSLLPDFVSPNYSRFDATVKHNISTEYMSYYDSINKLMKTQDTRPDSFAKHDVKNFLTGETIDSIDDLTYMIYNTYMCSRGTYVQAIEQTNNFVSILKTHKAYMEQILTGKNEYDIFKGDEIEELKKNDFGYSSDVAYLTGRMISAELKKKNQNQNLAVKWRQLLDQPIDSMANNRGLRDEGENFFGQKGYYVIYKKIIDEGFEDLFSILNEDISELKRYYKLQELNLTFEKEQKNRPLEKVLFHVVDKTQRGGAREIFVMDYTTKLYQQPIEKYFKIICEFIDNEIISVAAAKRSSLIHHKLFEYRSQKYKTYYLTYDCRKWAPRSNPDKYLHFVLGLADILPQDFINSVYHYFSIHNKKEIHTRRKIADNIRSNENHKELQDYLIDDDEKKSSYFVMPYSFVMGIFNMLSSLMHAGSQNLAKYVIESRAYTEGWRVDIVLFAHSDDSGGRFSALLGYPSVQRDLGTYEFIQKCNNHLMSVKKCNTSQDYFELLSILYICHQLLPLMPKFVSNVSLNVSGQGLSTDMKQVISKSIEVQSNGATVGQAYKLQVILSGMYRNIYRVKEDLSLPAFGGFCNSLPPFYLAYGSAADECRLFLYNYPLYRKVMYTAADLLDYDVEDGTPNLNYKKQIRIPKVYNDIKDRINLPIFEDNVWFFSNNKTRNSKVNILWFRAMLENSNFAISLLNINEIKRFLDTIYMASGKNIIGKTSFYDINELNRKIQMSENITRVTEFEQLLNINYTPLLDLFRWQQGIPNPIFTVSYKGTIKPCQLQINHFGNLPVKEVDSMLAAVQMCKPELSKYMYKNKLYSDELNIIARYLQNMKVPKELKIVKRFLDFAQKTAGKNVFFYGTLPSEHRLLRDEEGVYELIRQNFHSKLGLSNTSARYNLNMTRSAILPSNLIDFCRIYMLYRVAKNVRSDLMSTVVLKAPMKGKTLSAAQVYIENETNYQDVLTFMNFSTYNEFTFDLKKIRHWAIWIKKQVRVGNRWAGPGSLYVALSKCSLFLEVFNDRIKEITYRGNIIDFDSYDQMYLTELFKQTEIDIRDTTLTDEDKHFGVDSEGRFGFYRSNQLRFGIQRCILDGSLKNNDIETTCKYSYSQGRHIVQVYSTHHQLITFDSMIMARTKFTDLVNLIDEKSSEPDMVNMLLGFTLENENVTMNKEYNIDELIESFINTDLYRLYHTNYQKGFSLKSWFVNDILTNLKTEHDIYKTLVDTYGMEDIMDILPEKNRSNLQKMSFFDIEDEEVIRLKAQLITLPELEARKLVIDLAAERGAGVVALAALPEAGDPNNFEEYRYKSGSLLPGWYTIDFFENLGTALWEGYNVLNRDSQMTIDTFMKPSESLLQSLPLLDKILSTTGTFLQTFSATSTYLSIVTGLVSMIFQDKHALLAFSNQVEKSMLKIFPRHPIYQSNWVALINSMWMNNLHNDSSTLKYDPKLEGYSGSTALLAIKIRRNLESKDWSIQYQGEPIKLTKPENIEFPDFEEELESLVVMPYIMSLNAYAEVIEPDDLLDEQTTIMMTGIYEQTFTKNEAIDLFSDIRDEMEGLIEYKQKDEFGGTVLCYSMLDTLRLLHRMTFSRKKYDVISPIFLPDLKAASIKVHPNLPDMFYYTNKVNNRSRFNRFIAKNDLVNMKMEVSGNIFQLLNVHPNIEELKKKITGDEITSKIIQKSYKTSDRELYFREEFREFLIKEMDLNTNEKEEFVNKMNDTSSPREKLKYISNLSKVKESKQGSLDQMILSAIKGDKESKKSDLIRDEKIPSFLTLNKDELYPRLLNLTTEKKGLAQLDSLMNGTSAMWISNNINISISKKKNLNVRLERAKKDLRSIRANSYAMAVRVMQTILNDMPNTDTTNQYGHDLVDWFDDLEAKFINKYNLAGQEDDIDDLIPPGTVKNFGFNP